MYVPKKSKYVHLDSLSYKGRHPLAYYVNNDWIGNKKLQYLLLEILNTSTFPEDEIISFCEKCKKKAIGIIDIQNGLYRACEKGIHYIVVEKFILTLTKVWFKK